MAFPMLVGPGLSIADKSLQEWQISHASGVHVPKDPVRNRSAWGQIFNGFRRGVVRFGTFCTRHHLESFCSITHGQPHLGCAEKCLSQHVTHTQF